MKFYCIATTQRKAHAQLLESVCQKHNLEFVLIDPEHFNFDFTCEPHSILYRASNYRHHLARETEIFLVNKTTTTFHSSFEKAKFSFFSGITDHALHWQHNIPTPSSYVYNNQSGEQLEQIIEKLGGFPIIVKATGFSEGKGVMKVDSLSSFLSVMDFIRGESSIILLKQFIEVPKPVYSCRAIVIGQKVAFAYKNQSVSEKDVRSNADQSARSRSIITLNEQDQKDLVKTVNVLSLELGAVDFIYDKQNELKVLEVNFPFNFLPVVEDLQFPIHEKIVEFLVQKAKTRAGA